jgi:PAS domain-containing protein
VIVHVSKRRGVTDYLDVFQSIGTMFFDLETDLLIVLDEQGNIDRVNPMFERLLGRMEIEVLGMAIIRLVHVDDLAKFLKSFTQLQPEPIRLLRHPDGEIAVRFIACRFKAQRGFIILRRV